MHPDTPQLAAYLDGALGATERAELRGHILTCPACAARLEQLRADAQLITRSIAASGPAPDVRATVRARLRRRRPVSWLARGGALAGGFAGAVAALLLFAVLIGARSSGVSFGRVPDRLFVVNIRSGQLIALDPTDGKELTSAVIGASPSKVRYDERRGRLYVMLNQAIVAIDPQTLAEIGRWDALQPFANDAGIAIDGEHARLYVALPGGIVALALDTPQPTEVRTFSVASSGALALTPDGRTLFALDQQAAMLWALDLQSGVAGLQPLPGGVAGRRGWLAMSPNGQHVYALRQAGASSSGQAREDDPAMLWRIDTGSGRTEGPFPITAEPWSQDLLAIDAGHLAISRGDGRIGGVEIVDTANFQTTDHLDPSYDEHNLVGGPRGSLFALNWLHHTVTRYSLDTQVVTWRVEMNDHFFRDGVYVRGGWRWPW